jgi:integrase
MARDKQITIRTVEAMKPSDILWDVKVKGFGVRCQRRAKIYLVKSRVNGRQRWIVIGPHGSPWTPEKARDRAKAILGDIADGVDVAALRENRKAIITVEELAIAFLAEHVDAKRKATTARGYHDILERIVLPRLGKMSVPAVEHADIARLHHALRRTPYAANRAIAVISKMFNWAEQHGHRSRSTNPCKDIEKFTEFGRERFLSATEITALAKALEASERDGTVGIYAIAAIRLLILTGARLGEILSLRWQNVDIDQALLNLPDSKTGAKPIYLNAPALEVLAKLPRLKNNPHVIPGGKTGAGLVNLQAPWRRVRQRATFLLWEDNTEASAIVAELVEIIHRVPTAPEILKEAKRREIELPNGLLDVRIHDLRHSFASMAAAGGASLPIIGALLGHRQSTTTAKYAHLAADPLRAANDAIGERIAAAMRGPVAEILPMHNRRS